MGMKNFRQKSITKTLDFGKKNLVCIEDCLGGLKQENKSKIFVSLPHGRERIRSECNFVAKCNSRQPHSCEN